MPGKRHGEKDEPTSKADDKSRDDGKLPEYDFSGGVRGKYAERFADGCNVVVLDPDVAERFKTSEEVNRALRDLAKQQAS